MTAFRGSEGHASAPSHVAVFPHRQAYDADYLPDCDDAPGVMEGWPITVATFQALRRREHGTDAIRS